MNLIKPTTEEHREGRKFAIERFGRSIQTSELSFPLGLLHLRRLFFWESQPVAVFLRAMPGHHRVALWELRGPSKQ
jgi:hypothetical protein